MEHKCLPYPFTVSVIPTFTTCSLKLTSCKPFCPPFFILLAVSQPYVPLSKQFSCPLSGFPCQLRPEIPVPGPMEDHRTSTLSFVSVWLWKQLLVWAGENQSSWWSLLCWASRKHRFPLWSLGVIELHGSSAGPRNGLKSLLVVAPSLGLCWLMLCTPFSKLSGWGCFAKCHTVKAGQVGLTLLFLVWKARAFDFFFRQ